MTNQGQAYLRTGGFLLKYDSMIGDTTQPDWEDGSSYFSNRELSFRNEPIDRELDWSPALWSDDLSPTKQSQNSGLARQWAHPDLTISRPWDALEILNNEERRVHNPGNC